MLLTLSTSYVQKMSTTQYPRAVGYAARKHVNQRRKNKTQDPYINHPIEVAELILECGESSDVILSAAVLHDVIEDTVKNTAEAKAAAVQEIRQEFGEPVARLVESVTDDKLLDKVTRKRLQIEHVSELTCMYGTKMIKLGDKYSNLKTMKSDPPTFWSEDICRGYIYWSYAVVRRLRGTNEKFDEKFDVLFAELGVPSNIDEILDAELEKYYSLI